MVDVQLPFAGVKVFVFVPLFAPTGHVHQIVPVDVGIYDCLIKFMGRLIVAREKAYVVDRMSHERAPVACILIDGIVLVGISG